MLTTSFVPGAPDWLDLAVPDTDAAVAFYRGLFGWTFRSAGPEAGGYGFFLHDGRTVAGVGPSGKNSTATWTVYFHTPDADATAEAVRQAGGTVTVMPMDVTTAGRMAHFTDPTGADFGVWQPRDRPGMEVVMEDNSLSWTELYTTDSARAKDFYRAVFSWETRDVPMGGVDYTVVSPAGGGQERSHGGILQLQRMHLDAGSASEWHPYFAVADCDAAFATATGQGATELIPPMDTPGFGRLAMVNDPFGATLALRQAAAS